MSVEIKLFDDLAAVAADADGALDRAHQRSIYHRLDWFERTLAHCPVEGTPLVARARNGTGSAWLFLTRRGSSAESLSSWYSHYFDLVRSGEGEALAAAVVGGLKGLARVTLSPVVDPEPLARAFRQAGWLVFVSAKTSNWITHPPAVYESFWEALPSRVRNTVTRKRKKAGLEIVIHRGFDERAWADYQAIYGQSWKPEEGSWDFMRGFAEAEGAAGTLRLGIAYHQGAPVAAQLWHVENGHATINKLAYAESAKAMSPGSILSEAMFRHVIENDRPTIIDYGTGDEPYKADWMTEARTLWRIDAYDPRRPASWPALLRHGLSLVRRRLSH